MRAKSHARSTGRQVGVSHSLHASPCERAAGAVPVPFFALVRRCMQRHQDTVQPEWSRATADGRSSGGRQPDDAEVSQPGRDCRLAKCVVSERRGLSTSPAGPDVRAPSRAAQNMRVHSGHREQPIDRKAPSCSLFVSVHVRRSSVAFFIPGPEDPLLLSRPTLLPSLFLSSPRLRHFSFFPTHIRRQTPLLIFSPSASLAHTEGFSSCRSTAGATPRTPTRP